jgi:hypothetical protein
MQNNPSVHTYSPMPYLIENTKKDRIFVYQHGTQWKSANTLMAVPFYIPLTYFIWSDLWAESFEDASHPDSQIISVGSPWHDHLAKSYTETKPKFDVLLISQSHDLQTQAEDERYKKFVKTIVEVCERNKLDLKIKLHPKESNAWYRDHGLSNYIDEFEDIDIALQQTQVAVTDHSSAFVESSVYGTPIVVADIHEKNLSSLAPVQGVFFPETIEDLPSAIIDALNGDIPETDRSIVKTGGATKKIISAIRSKQGY